MSDGGKYMAVVEEARAAAGDKPSAGPVYRHISAKDGMPTLDATTLFELFERSAEKYASNACLGSRPIDAAGKAGPFVFKTYAEVAAQVKALASGLAAIGGAPEKKIGVLGPNCPEWMVSMQVGYRWDVHGTCRVFFAEQTRLHAAGPSVMNSPPRRWGAVRSEERPPRSKVIARRQICSTTAARLPPRTPSVQACNRLNTVCVPLYDSLGENAIEYIINHSEAVIAFVAASKLPALAKALPKTKDTLKAVVYWGTGNEQCVEVGELQRSSQVVPACMPTCDHATHLAHASPHACYTGADCQVPWLQGLLF